MSTVMRGRLFILGVATFVALALTSVPASADGIDGGTVHLKLGTGLAKALKQEGVRLVGVKPAKAGNADVTLPVSSGLLDPKSGSGYLFLKGGFRLRAGKREVELKQLVLNTAKRLLGGKVDGAQMTIAKLPPQQASVDGFSLDLSLKSLQLTGRAAFAFNRRLALDGVFKAGRSLGSAAAVARFEWLTIRGGEMTFTIDQTFKEKLAAVETDVGASGSAKVRGTSPTVISAPIEGGQVAPDASLGVLLSQGGLAFTQPNMTQFGEPFNDTVAFLDTTVALDSHLVSGDANYQPNPRQIPFSGPVATFPQSIAVHASPASGEISASSLPLALHPNLVPVLNEALGAPKGHPSYFGAGEIIGTIAFKAKIAGNFEFMARTR